MQGKPCSVCGARSLGTLNVDHKHAEDDMTTISPLRDETDRDWNAEWLAEVRRVTKYRITKKLTALAEQFVDDRASLAAMMDGAQDAVMNWTPPK